jgi:NAD(P)-dependent dehydrogenase (short-subunit alcohol dehydrogenase family)
MHDPGYARLPPGWTAADNCLSDRVVLVTGAAGGLGRAGALAVARAGATAVLLGRKVRPLEKIYDEVAALGYRQPAIYPLDLEGASPRDYEDMAAGIEQEFGRLDGVVNAAAHFSGLQPAASIEPMDWLRTLHVNLSAPFLMLQACLPLMTRAADASVVFVLEDLARVGRAHWGAYGVAKHGLAGLVSILQQETEAGPVHVHALLPPPLRTALRRTAYFGENSITLPKPDAVADALIYLLSADGAPARGKVLDARGEGRKERGEGAHGAG